MPSVVMSIMQGPLCGALANMLLYGVICMQTFRYWQAYEHDRNILKCLVAFILILETAHTALTIYTVEFYLIMHFGDTTSLEYAMWCVNFFILLFRFIHCFIWRVLQLSQKRWIAVCFVRYISMRSKFSAHALVIIFEERVYPTMVVGWVLSAGVDSAIAFTLCLYLRKLSPILRQIYLVAFRTDNVLNCLLLYTINTGAITSFCAVLVVIMFLGLPNNLAFVGFVQVQSERLSDSVATLNS
ncbi:uncharacterized protein HD556DRAFT_1239507 [Suillus plorans]|uniref:DUF6534 domain-containing protein n=1 Tax=Suillus plorans TaxID=116603 RepID=A0A9P7DGZ0_9AGAM|nr:uncharacterized protein HD556DRAFT_1239507 [Suillus plorans]KAG1792317.1 hypothetical protein HD556DRAFT_1239507 [Suillus plorans]